MTTKFKIGDKVWAISTTQLKSIEFTNTSSLNRNDPTITAYEIKGPLTVTHIQIDSKGTEYRMNDSLLYKESVLHGSFADVSKHVGAKFKEVKPEKEKPDAVSK